MKKIILFLFVAITLFGCKAENKAIAKVAGKKITQAEFDLEFERIAKISVPADYEMTENDTLVLKKQVLNTLIQKKMFEKKLDQLNIEADQEEIDQMIQQIISQYGSEEKMNADLTEKGFTLEELKEEFAYRNRLTALSKYIDELESTATEDELLAYYTDNLTSKFTNYGLVTARHILINFDNGEDDSLNKVNEIKEEIKGGLSFADAAVKYSDGPSGKDGGLLPPFKQGQMVEEFYEAAVTTPVQTVSEPVRTQYGYHLVYVENRDNETVATFEETKEFIKAQIKQTAFLEEIEKDAKIVKPDWAEDK